MNVADLLGAPVTDQPDLTPRPTPSCKPSAPIETTPTPPTKRRLLGTALLVAAVAIGGMVGWLANSASNTGQTATVVTAALAPQVGEVAELFTAMYLSGTTPTQSLVSTDFTPPAGGGTWVNNAAALGVTERSDGNWDVLVAVDALELTNDVYQQTQLQYFAITVSGAGDHPVVISAPARVPPPASAAAASAPVFAQTVAPDQQEAIDAFLVGYLTGAEDVARYMTPTARVRLFAEPPYNSIAVETIDADELGMARVTLAATTTGGSTHVLTYVVETMFTAGVWEVASISGNQISQ
ncbi:MAG: conjugal transfer protein [Acidimicrobiia bacterium]|nr:conjugal transfer protein [Acidimicrobiia bacterium]